MKPLLASLLCIAALAVATPSNASYPIRAGTLLPDADTRFTFPIKGGEAFTVIVQGKGSPIVCAIGLVGGTEAILLDSKGANCWGKFTAPKGGTAIYKLGLANGGSDLLTYTLSVQ